MEDRLPLRQRISLSFWTKPLSLRKAGYVWWEHSEVSRGEALFAIRFRLANDEVTMSWNTLCFTSETHCVFSFFSGQKDYGIENACDDFGQYLFVICGTIRHSGWNLYFICYLRFSMPLSYGATKNRESARIFWPGSLLLFHPNISEREGRVPLPSIFEVICSAPERLVRENPCFFNWTARHFHRVPTILHPHMSK